MYKKIKGFTLLEMMVVIVIMALMLGVSMKFGSNSLVELKYQTVKEQFMSDFGNVYTTTIASSYIDQKRYDFLQIKINSGDSYWHFYYTGVEINKKMTGVIEGMSFNSIYLDGVAVEDMMFEMQPYKIGCSISTQYEERIVTGSLVTFGIVSLNKEKKYCFEINSNNCKLIQTICN